MVREFFRSLPGVVVIVAVCLALMAVLTYALAFANRPLLDIERENIQHSRQYVETKVSLLQNLRAAYLRLNVEIAESQSRGQDEIVQAQQAQQAAIVSQMHNEASMIPASEVPAEVAAFLAVHPIGGQ
jgi:hypothetical protein